MRRRGDDRHARSCPRALAALVVLATSLALAARGQAAGLVGANYALNWNQNADKTDAGTTSSWTFKHSLDVRYRGLLSPVVQNEITVKVEQETKSSGEPRSVTRISPTITIGYAGSYWSAGAKRMIEESNEPGNVAKTTDSYFAELFYSPALETMPDLKGKYTIDHDFQAGTADTVKRGLTLSSVYRPNSWLEVKGDYGKNQSDDRLKPDSDTEDDKYSAAVGIRHVVSSRIRVNSEFRFENSTGRTILSAGGTSNNKHDATYNWRNSLVFRMFRNTILDGAYDWSEKQNVETGEHNYSKNFKLAASQRIYTLFDVRADFSRTVSEVRHTADDNQKTDDTWTLDARANLSQLLDLGLKWQKKDTTEEHFGDPTRNTTSGGISKGATWTATFTPFWRGSAAWDRTETIDRGNTTAVETKYSLKSTFEFKPFNLTVDPSYDISLRSDFVKTPAVDTETRDLKFRIAWLALSTDSITGKMEHTFGRKVDTAAKNIQRTDSSTVNVAWVAPLPNWNVGIDVARSASDTSEDDLPPDISEAFGVKADYRYERFSLGASYKYDLKRLSDDSENIDIKCGWTAPRWDVTLTYTFKKTFSVALSEGYTLAVAFKYNL